MLLSYMISVSPCPNYSFDVFIPCRFALSDFRTCFSAPGFDPRKKLRLLCIHPQRTISSPEVMRKLHHNERNGGQCDEIVQKTDICVSNDEEITWHNIAVTGPIFSQSLSIQTYLLASSYSVYRVAKTT